MYDPVSGRFLQGDPIAKALQTPFVYASGSPVRRLDANGFSDMSAANAEQDSPWTSTTAAAVGAELRDASNAAGDLLGDPLSPSNWGRPSPGASRALQAAATTALQPSLGKPSVGTGRAAAGVLKHKAQALADVATAQSTVPAALETLAGPGTVAEKREALGSLTQTATSEVEITVDTLTILEGAATVAAARATAASGGFASKGIGDRIGA